MIKNYRKLFESEFSLDYDTEYKPEELPDKIEMAGYTWSKIGKIDGDLLYLCDKIVRRMAFSKNENNDWKESIIRRWLNTEFYEEIPSKYKYRIVKHNNDNLFLLSTTEFKMFTNNISNVHKFWWLRSPGYYTDSSVFISKDGNVDYEGEGVFNISMCVRPALLLW